MPSSETNEPSYFSIGTVGTPHLSPEKPALGGIKLGMILSPQTLSSLKVFDPDKEKLFHVVEPFHSRTLIRNLTFGLGPAGYDIRCRQRRKLSPGDFVLVSSIEYFRMPNHVQGEVKDKSSWARRGLFVQNTVIEPGWQGYLTLELTAHLDVIVEEGDPIAQVVFQLLDKPSSHPYCGRYQGQGPEPTSAV